jgi:FkbM family methyltransferase
MLPRLLARLPNYLSAFGIVHGLRLAWAVERWPARDDRSRRRALAVPGLGAPVQLRRSVSDHAIFWQCLVMRQYDLDRYPHARRLDEAYRAELAAGRRPVVVDCGANIGLATLWFARRFPEAVVVAIEPDAGNFALLEANTRHLGERVQCVRGAVWPESTALEIENPESGSAAFRVRPAQPGETGTVAAYSVADLARLGGDGALLVVKIDIEGAQSRLFEAGTEWVGRAHLVTLELDDWLMPWAGTSRSFFACLSRHPYEYLLGGESIFCFRDAGAPAAVSAAAVA